MSHIYQETQIEQHLTKWGNILQQNILVEYIYKRVNNGLTNRTERKYFIKPKTIFRSDPHDLWPPAKATTPSDLGGSAKRLLHGHSVEDEFMEGTVTSGHLVSPDGGKFINNSSKKALA